MPRTNRPPKLCHHKATGQGYVLLNGKERYLGVYGATDTLAAYNRVIAEWLSSGRTIATARAVEGPIAGADFTVTELCVAFHEHAVAYYRTPAGKPTGEMAPVKQALRMLRKNYGDTAVAAFGPLALRAVRQSMIEAKWTRKNINRQVARVRHVFRWGVSRELVSPTVLTALEAVEPLHPGRSEAVESEPVDCVPMEHVEAVKPHVSRQVRAMIEVQLLTAMRPGEVCRMRMRDIKINKSKKGEETWTYTLAEHKTAHHNKKRTVAIGPKGIEILRPFIHENIDAYFFDPREAEQERNAARRAARSSPVTPSQKARRPKRSTKAKGTKGERYTTNSYRVAIARACAKANRLAIAAAQAKGRKVKDEELVQEWHPNQLRHNAATAARADFGIEGAAARLGHAKASTTLTYAPENPKLLQRMAKKLG
jgi:integrase